MGVHLRAGTPLSSAGPKFVVHLYRRSDDGLSERLRLHPSVFSVFSVFSVRSVVHFGMDAT
jgi:hypothetical protein